MKRPISWHMECLINRESYIAALERQLDRLGTDIQNLRSQNNFLKRQIEEAKRRGKDSFDEEKFLRKVAKHFD